MKVPAVRLMIVPLILSHLLLVTCDKNSTNTEDTPPVMPPQESMMVDLSAFSAGGNQSLTKTADPQTQVHFATAAFTLGLVNLAVAVHLAVPVYIFSRALLEKPELQSDGKFHWTYATVYQLFNYEADLAGWVDVPNAEVNWEMYVTQERKELDHFMWYNGHCNTEATTGDWTFFDASQPDLQIPVIQIDWLITGETERILNIENVFEGNAAEGDQLIYQIDGDTTRVQYLDVSEGTTAKIVWHTETVAGYIQAPNYNAGIPGHWDENQQDLN